MENLKEYLRKNSNGTYSYIGTVRPEHVSDFMIEIPEGATAARLCDDVEFYKNDFGVFFSLTSGNWLNTISPRGVLMKNIVWQRAQHPEELPFIDDEPKYTDDEVKYMDENGQGRLQSINDKYVEIEQVRQNGLKLDNGKPRHSLLPKGSISSIIAVLEFGAKKYEANNWQKVNNAKERYYDAAMRHIDSWWNGEKFDQETGIHHLAHAATNLFFLKWFDDKDNNNE